MSAIHSEQRRMVTSAVRLIDPDQDHRWDDFVEKHPFGWLTHLSGWKKVLEESFNHMEGYYLALTDDTGEVIRAALPLFAVNSWLTGKRMVSTPFATLCDPLITTGKDMEELHGAVSLLSKGVGASYVEIRTHLSSSLVDDSDYGVQRFYKQHAIRLSPDHEKIRKTFHRSCVRQRIARAENSGLTVKTGDRDADLDIFYRLHKITRRRLHLPPQPYKFIRSIWKTFAPSQRVKLLLAYHNDQPIAGLILMQYKGRVSAEFSAMDDGFKDVSPIHFLFWEAIKSACCDGYDVFDFGRTSPLNESLMAFKSHWGAELLDLPQLYYPKQALEKFGTNENSAGSRLVKKICSFAPDFALEYIGNFCYQHLG